MRRTRSIWVTLLLAACNRQAAPPASPAASEPPPASASDAPQQGKSAAMWHHFWDVALARDAVVRGNIDDARQILLRVAAPDQDEPVPQDWLPWIDEMRSEAKKASDAKTLVQMAALVTSVSEQCAECHRTTRGGLSVQVDNLEYGHVRPGLQGAMARHAWATDELWVGMTMPSSSSWIRGARALGEFPVPGAEAWEAAQDAGAGRTPSASDAGVSENIDPALIEGLLAVRALGQKAEEAGQPAQQTEVFSELLVKCGNCHRARAVDQKAPNVLVR